MAFELEIGQIIGAWQVLEKLNYKRKYKCLCTACGVTVQHIRVHDLVKGKTLMCKNCSGKRTETSKPIEYHSWVAMLQRCYNKNSKDYKNYGARGISVFPLWKESFEAFFMMMGPRPTPQHTLDRIDCNGNYVPGNVRWETRDAQTRNKRDNVKLTLRGETRTVSKWAEDSDCPVTAFTIYKRLKRGWEPERAVFEPSQQRKSSDG